MGTTTEGRQAGYTAYEMREGSYNASEMKPAGYTMHEMRAAGYTAAEMLGADFACSDCRRVQRERHATKPKLRISIDDCAKSICPECVAHHIGILGRIQHVGSLTTSVLTSFLSRRTRPCIRILS